MAWRPDPPAGTQVCGGFDGSENDDWTCIKLETREGYLFTPRYGHDRRPTIWQPKQWPNERIPRGEVRAAWAELAKRYSFRRVYCDPGFHDETSWESEIAQWDLDYGGGADVFTQWATSSVQRMYPALRRFEADLGDFITHDGCPLTATAFRNARRFARGDRYILGKPAQHQKIDPAVTAVICHEAASDERAAGWLETTDSRMFVLG